MPSRYLPEIVSISHRVFCSPAQGTLATVLGGLSALGEIVNPKRLSLYSQATTTDFPIIGAFNDYGTALLALPDVAEPARGDRKTAGVQAAISVHNRHMQR